MKRSNEEEAKRWLQQAKRDLDDAIFSKEGQRYNLACFLSQQAAEKAIKAYLYSQGAEFVWGHSVAELINDATQFDKSFVEIKKEGGSLDKYYIPTRYPNGLPGGIPSEAFIEEDAISAINKATKIIKFVEEKIEALCQ